MLTLDNISYTYPEGTTGLQNISLEIEQGKSYVFLGENGAGKSSLFLCLIGILKPHTGTYQIEGKTFQFSAKEKKRIAGKIAYVFQDPDVQLFATTVYEDIAFGPFNLKLDKEEIDKRVNKYAQLLGVDDLLNKAPHQLSYGQKKRVAVAGVLAMEPEVILFDEPFAWLDQKHQKVMKKIISDLQKEGRTILISTHNPDFAYEWADQVVFMKKGEIIAQGNPLDIMHSQELMQQIEMNVPLVVRIAQKLGKKEFSRSIEKVLE
jgi:cobalt/nickel transport system ATP-binding protein